MDDKKPVRRRSAPKKEPIHRDWKTVMTPIMITVGISMGAQIVAGIWQGAMFKAQVLNIDQHQKVQDEAIKANSEALQAIMTRLPIDYMPRVEIEQNRERVKEVRDLENARLDNIDRKIDTIISGQTRR